MSNDLSKYNLEQLRKIAKHYSVSGYQEMTQKELVSRLSAILNIEQPKATEQNADDSNIKQLKNKYRHKKLRNDSGIIVHRRPWRWYAPRIILLFLLAFELITFIDPLVTHFAFSDGAMAMSISGGFVPLMKSVAGRDWGLIMAFSAISFAWTLYIFSQLIKTNSFNYMFFVSIALGAGYFFYYMFRQFDDFKEAQKFINTYKDAVFVGKFKELLGYYWAIMALSLFFFTVPTFVVVVNFVTNH